MKPRCHFGILLFAACSLTVAAGAPELDLALIENHLHQTQQKLHLNGSPLSSKGLLRCRYWEGWQGLCSLRFKKRIEQPVIDTQAPIPARIGGMRPGGIGDENRARAFVSGQASGRWPYLGPARTLPPRH